MGELTSLLLFCGITFTLVGSCASIIILCMLLCVRIKDRCTRVKKKVLIESRDLEEFVQL
jgi:hypothetical protein